MFCPAITGGKNWEPTSYNPQLRTIFVTSTEGCSGMRTVTRLDHFEGKLDGTTKKRSTWTGGATLDRAADAGARRHRHAAHHHVPATRSTPSTSPTAR